MSICPWSIIIKFNYPLSDTQAKRELLTYLHLLGITYRQGAHFIPCSAVSSPAWPINEIFWIKKCMNDWVNEWMHLRFLFLKLCYFLQFLTSLKILKVQQMEEPNSNCSDMIKGEFESFTTFKGRNLCNGMLL